MRDAVEEHRRGCRRQELLRLGLSWRSDVPSQISTLRPIVNALGGELEVSARFAAGAVEIERFDEASGGKAGSLWIPGGVGNDEIGAYASGCWPGLALPDGIGCPQGFDE